MDFWKMNGNGNDFIVVDGSEHPGMPWSLSARRWCDRRKGLGADGLLLTLPSSKANFCMKLFNADGSEAEMCGNGARCIARFAYERGIASRSMTFETLAGAVKARVDGSWVELVMNGFVWQEEWMERQLRFVGETWRCAWIDTGVPHLVMLCSQLPDRDTCRSVGAAARNELSLFPQGTNVTFTCPAGRGELEAVTYERGVEDLTDSCGTGCVAAAFAARRLWGMGSVVEVANPGGVNRVTLLDGQSALLGGKTALVAKGQLVEE